MSFKAGVLAQLQAEMTDVAGTNATATNLSFRRLRFVTEFTLGERLSVFFQTDNPNLGEANAAGARNFGDAYVQDFAVTYEPSRRFTLDPPSCRSCKNLVTRLSTAASAGRQPNSG